jgi:hypothetical protein
MNLQGVQSARLPRQIPGFANAMCDLLIMSLIIMEDDRTCEQHRQGLQFLHSPMPCSSWQILAGQVGSGKSLPQMATLSLPTDLGEEQSPSGLEQDNTAERQSSSRHPLAGPAPVSRHALETSTKAATHPTDGGTWRRGTAHPAAHVLP